MCQNTYLQLVGYTSDYNTRISVSVEYNYCLHLCTIYTVVRQLPSWHLLYTCFENQPFQQRVWRQPSKQHTETECLSPSLPLMQLNAMAFTELHVNNYDVDNLYTNHLAAVWSTIAIGWVSGNSDGKQMYLRKDIIINFKAQFSCFEYMVTYIPCKLVASTSWLMGSDYSGV